MQIANDSITHSSETGIVIAYFGSTVTVEDSRGQVITCQLRRNQTLPVVGDRVQWRWENASTGVIIAIVERQSLLARGDRQGKLKPLAANIDYIFIVMAPPPIFAEHLVDRYLVAAEILGIQPVLVLNKTDLMGAAEKKAAVARLLPYQAIPYPVVLANTVRPKGMQALAKFLAKHSGVLVGPSGVGKSSLIAHLSQQAIRVGEVSTKGSGKHTTTATRYYHLPKGGSLIDSPGVREFALWPVPLESLMRAFPEFKPYLNTCRFRDCRHLAEPGCAVQNAVEAGKISAERYTSYQNLSKETSG